MITPDCFFKGRSQEKTQRERPDFFLASEPVFSRYNSMSDADICDAAREIEEGAKAAVSSSIRGPFIVEPENKPAGDEAKTQSVSNQVVLSRPGVAELADAADSKSAGDHSPCGFDSLLRDQHRKTFIRLFETRRRASRRPVFTLPLHCAETRWFGARCA